MKETLIVGDGKPSTEDPKPNPKPPVKVWEYLIYDHLSREHTES